MDTWTIVIIALMHIPMLFLFVKPRKSALKPRGGRRIKNIIAWLIIKAGRSLKENKLDLSLVNQRVPLPEGQDEENYNDSFVFQGSDSNGNLFMSRIGFRDGGREAEVWVWLTIDGKRYYNKESVVALDPAEQELISAGGLTFSCTDQEKSTWQIKYSGHLGPDKKNCSIDLNFEPRSQIYHSGIHFNAMTFAKSMAEMPWSREYFDRLRSENQCRIEQGGTLRGTVEVDGKTLDADMLSIRDHSWGKRNWTFINRYIWNIISLEDDVIINEKKYRYLVFSTVNYGTTFKHLVTGWIAGPDSVLPIVKASDMTEFGEDGVVPGESISRFQAKGGPVMSLSVKRSAVEHSWFTQENRFEICEAYCSAEVDGIKGHGMSEYGYSKEAGYKRDFPGK